MTARVTAVNAIPVSVPTETAYETSLSVATGGQGAYDHVVVTVETDTGVVGIGEVAPLSTWPHGLTRKAVVDLIHEKIAPLLEGEPVHRIRRFIDRAERVLSSEPFPLYGVEIALHDALGKIRDLPVYDLLGGAPNNDTTIDLHCSIGIKSPEEVRAEAHAASEAGYTAFKVKVGGQDFETEKETVSVIADSVPDARIRIDANQGWSVAEAVTRVRTLNETANGLTLVEQPVPFDDIQGLKRVRRATGVPVLADESCFSPADAATLGREGACDIINIKLAKTGGLVRATDVAVVANAHGLPCFMGSMLELGIGAAASAHFTAASPAITYPTGILNIHAVDSLIEEREQWTPDEDTFSVPDGPGLGVTLNEAALNRYRVD